MKWITRERPPGTSPLSHGAWRRLPKGFRLTYQDDQKQLAAEPPVYDALYA